MIQLYFSKKAKKIGADQTARMRRLVCACVVRNPPEDRFSRVEAHLKHMFSIREIENVNALRRATHARIQKVLSEGVQI